MSFLFHSLTKSESREGRSSSRDRGTSPGRHRSLSPFRRKKRDSSAEGVRRDSGGESEPESDAAPVNHPSNAFDESDTDSDEEQEAAELYGSSDEEMFKNTELNASERTPYDFLVEEGPVVYPGEGPNLVAPTPTVDQRPLRRKSTKTKKDAPLKLDIGRTIYEKNRATITLTHGDPAQAREKRRPKTYLVASDLSDESLYALQWAIGTVIREGDECLVVTIAETSEKFDVDVNETAEDRKNKYKWRRDREANAQLLSRQATALLEKTRLNVIVTCQAVHAKNVRHMLLDMIDYHEPTLVIVGTRGLDKIKGMLLGSVSNYLIQKSSSPVMVTRRPLRVSRTVHRKLSTLNREARTSLARAQTEKESKGGAVEEPAEPSDIHEQVEKMTVHDANAQEEARSSVEEGRPQAEPPRIVEPEGAVDPEASSLA